MASCRDLHSDDALQSPVRPVTAASLAQLHGLVALFLRATASIVLMVVQQAILFLQLLGNQRPNTSPLFPTVANPAVQLPLLAAHRHKLPLFPTAVEVVVLLPSPVATVPHRSKKKVITASNGTWLEQDFS